MQKQVTQVKAKRTIRTKKFEDALRYTYEHAKDTKQDTGPLFFLLGFLHNEIFGSGPGSDAAITAMHDRIRAPIVVNII